jgi:hypothetical protein
MKAVRLWSKREEAKLAKIYPTHSVPEVMEIMGRTEGSVTAKAFELGVSVPKKKKVVKAAFHRPAKRKLKIDSSVAEEIKRVIALNSAIRPLSPGHLQSLYAVLEESIRNDLTIFDLYSFVESTLQQR